MRSNTLTNIPLLSTSKSQFYKEMPCGGNKIIINDSGKKEENTISKINNSPNFSSNNRDNFNNSNNNKIKDNNFYSLTYIINRDKNRNLFFYSFVEKN